MTPAFLMQLLLMILCIVVGLTCLWLSRKLTRLNDLETGLGGAIAVMAAEIARLEHAMGAATTQATAATRALSAEIDRAKAEQALWALQRGMAAAQPRRSLRRRRSVGGADA